MKSINLLILPALLLSTASAMGHHSSAQFDRSTQIVLEGTLVEYDWSNPHVYLWLEVESDDGVPIKWEIEGQPPAILKRVGWSRDSIKVGDRVKVTGNPGRNPDAHIALMETLETTDNTVLTGGGALLQEKRVVTARATGIAGVWTTEFNLQDYTNFSRKTIPATEKGRQAIESYNEAEDSPGIECIPISPPAIMLTPDTKSIEIRDNSIVIRGEFDSITRTVHLDQTSHEGAVDSVMGHSIGHWEDNVLIVDTTHFTPQRIINIGLGLPSSPAKHLVERFELNEDGTQLLYGFQLEDPEYLAEPIVVEGAKWDYRPDVEYEALPCSRENASRFTLE